MRQTRLVLMVGGGVLLLCVLALVVSLADYTQQQPTVANAHVPPVVGAPGAAGTPTPADVPTIPVTTVDVPTAAPAPTPSAAPQRSRVPVQQPTLAEILQQLQQRRHHRPPLN
jgi:hypothetical protein